MYKKPIYFVAVVVACSAAIATAKDGDQATTRDSSWHQSHPQGITIREFQAMSSEDPAWQLDSPEPEMAPADATWRLCHPRGPTFREFQALSSDDPVWQLPSQAGAIPIAMPCDE